MVHVNMYMKQVSKANVHMKGYVNANNECCITTFGVDEINIQTYIYVKFANAHDIHVSPFLIYFSDSMIALHESFERGIFMIIWNTIFVCQIILTVL